MKWLNLEPTQEDNFAVEVCRREVEKLSKDQLIECLASLTYQLRIKNRIVAQLLKEEIANEPRS